MSDEESFLNVVRGVSSVIASSRRYTGWDLPAPPQFSSTRQVLDIKLAGHCSCALLKTIITIRLTSLSTVKESMDDPFRAVVLVSPAAGKSTVAIHHAVSRCVRKGVNILLWVDCSTTGDIRRSFGSIAEKLELPSYDVRDHDTNRDLVLDWLETTEILWSIIYANLKSLDSIEEYWPDETSKGRAIITATTDMTVSMTNQGKLRTIKRENVFNVAQIPEPFDVQENHYLLMTGVVIGRKMYTIDAMWTSFASWHGNSNSPMPVWRLASDTKDTGFIGVPSCTQENFLKRIGPGGAMVGLERTKKLLFRILHNQIHVHFDQFTVQDQVVVSAWSPHVSKLVDLLNALRPVYPQLPGSLELCHLLVLNAKFLLNQGRLEDVLKTVSAIRAVTGTPPSGQEGSDIKHSTYYLEWRVFAQRGEGQNALDSAIRLREISNTIAFPSVPPYQGASYLIAMSYITKEDYTNGLSWIGQCNNTCGMNVSVSPNT
ncbi:NB-ARC and TPR domain-containing protein [Penicillium hetheringtonii]|uniref:NB-ARC and TPR domain-containing protein n=1 Tax=Penicillium hetheringtonii TaxID=911720 RepID=A0AAD6GZ12_9EURO|nr:NB-ARC and TPR domain-containing protein [Penicillium hetheringtonii]